MEVELHFKNTLSRRLEPFQPLCPGTARMYTCGPTVYDFAHIGNLRTFLFEDILHRTLRLFDFEVTQVMNLTDVDDKTIRGASDAGISLREYTDHYVEAFFEDLRTLRVTPAQHYPRATDYVPQMVELVQKLEKRGYTYRSDDSIYFKIATFPGYGKLSGVRPEANIAGARVDADEYEKEDARDFVLWKAAKPDEPAWDTALGRGRPGWHLECSTMAMSLLGNTIDIHTGGVDNIFPHHENEIAQSEGATGKPFSRYWLHAEHLVVEGEKMAKSRGNFFTLRDLLDRGHDPLAIRYLLVSVPYRQKLNFTFDGLHAAEQSLNRLANIRRRLRNTSPSGDVGELKPSDVGVFRHELRKALGDDLNTARALGEVHKLLRACNVALDGNGVSAEARTLLDRALEDIDRVFDLGGDRVRESGLETAEIERLVEERAQARISKDFDRADAIRDRLYKRGIVLEDTPSGTVWHVRDRVS